MVFDTLHGIVVKYSDYKESDRILNVLTVERGFITLTARGCRKKNSPIASACELCAYSEFIVHNRLGIEVISSATLLEGFYPIREDYSKYESVEQILFLSKKLTYLSDRWDDAFKLCYYAVSFISYTDNNPIDIELCFLVKFLKLAGYEPKITECALCGKKLTHSKLLRFSKTMGGAMCDYCGSDSKQVMPISLEAIRRMLKLPIPEMKKVSLPENVRVELTDILYGYAEFNLEQTIKIRGI